jgi:hypothetical protein
MKERTEMERRVADAMRERAKEDATMESLARAAIRAMSEPTEEMKRAARVSALTWTQAYTAMIDAATPPIQDSATAAVPQEPGRHQGT